jgi:hypothetical protein
VHRSYLRPGSAGQLQTGERGQPYQCARCPRAALSSAHTALADGAGNSKLSQHEGILCIHTCSPSDFRGLLHGARYVCVEAPHAGSAGAAYLDAVSCLRQRQRGRCGPPCTRSRGARGLRPPGGRRQNLTSGLLSRGRRRGRLCSTHAGAGFPCRLMHRAPAAGITDDDPTQQSIHLTSTPHTCELNNMKS